MNIEIGNGVTLKLKDSYAVAHSDVEVSLSKESYSAIADSNAFLLKNAFDRMPIYGLNTQFGNQVGLYDVNLDGELEKYKESINARQFNLVTSHNCGIGDEISLECTRAAMLLRAHCLAQGYSGVREEAIQSLINFINSGITPIVYKFGSIGASGDLIPLSGVAAALCGNDVEVVYKVKKYMAHDALKLAGLKPLHLEVREGLALINGTSFFTAIAAVSLFELKNIFNHLLQAIAMSLESLCVIDSAYDPLVHTLKRNEGEIAINKSILEFWKGSKLLRNLNEIRKGESKDSFSSKHLQDYYSLRSVPQGFGLFYENLKTTTTWIEHEMNSINDNPIISADTKSIYQASNFMGFNITEACDLLKMDISQASSWIHAIIANLVHPRKNFGLPANLIHNPEIYNGFRPLQILTASIVVQNRKLAQSQQAFMIPTEGDNQDVNSLAMHAALDFKDAVANLEKLTAILYLASAQAIDLRGRKKASKRAQSVIESIRKTVPFIEEDRNFRTDITSVINFIKNNVLG